jgi:hypothetical protein
MTNNTPDIVTHESVKNILNAAARLATAVAREMELEDYRPRVKLQAIEHIMSSGDNKLTGKPHSFSSAETLVHVDDVYAAHLSQLREAAIERILAKGAYDAAIASARLQEPETHV